MIYFSVQAKNSWLPLIYQQPLSRIAADATDAFSEMQEVGVGGGWFMIDKG